MRKLRKTENSGGWYGNQKKDPISCQAEKCTGPGLYKSIEKNQKTKMPCRQKKTPQKKKSSCLWYDKYQVRYG